MPLLLFVPETFKCSVLLMVSALDHLVRKNVLNESMLCQVGNFLLVTVHRVSFINQSQGLKELP